MAARKKQYLKNLEPWQDPNAVPYVVIEELSKNFGENMAVNNVNLEIYKGELFNLLGGSGCGKSTLLRMLAGFETPSEGKIFIDDEDITLWPPYRRPVNMMFQSYALFPHMSVEENIRFGLKQEKLPKGEIRERVDEVLDLVQMRKYAERKPDQLSGGQRQRVALARSLAKRPKLLLLDEPLGALDKNLREQTQFELVNIQERVGITFIMVTHDQEEAMTMASRMGIMEDGQIRQVGTPHEIYEFPNSRFVADFIGASNLFDGIVVEDETDYLLVESSEANCQFYAPPSSATPVGSTVSVAIRPEKIFISKTHDGRQKRNKLSGIIKEIAYLGDMNIYYVELESGKVIMASATNPTRSFEQEYTWEEEVFLHWDEENVVVLSV